MVGFKCHNSNNTVFLNFRFGRMVGLGAYLMDLVDFTIFAHSIEEGRWRQGKNFAPDLNHSSGINLGFN